MFTGEVIPLLIFNGSDRVYIFVKGLTLCRDGSNWMC